MSGTEQANDAAGARERLDDDDHDLLTFGEAGERLQIEIAAAAERVADLEAVDASAELGAARDRLAALRSAASRNTAQRINDVNFERFFGYPGTARRNLAAPVND